MSLKNRLFSLFIFLFLIGNVHAQNKGINSSLAYEQITAQPIVLDGGPKTIIGQDFKYPSGTPLIKAFDIVIPAGKQTSLHSHAIPLYASLFLGSLRWTMAAKESAHLKLAVPI